MTDVQQTVSTPEAATALANGLQKFILAAIANHAAAEKSGGLAFEISADLTAAVAALGPVLGSLGALSDEAKTDTLGFVEAFAIAGIGTARALMAPKS
jgi:hypothetical protein